MRPQRRTERIIERRDQGIELHQGIFYIGMFSFALLASVLMLLFVKMFV